MKIALVYRTGGDYAPTHVDRLIQQIRRVGKLDHEILVFSDENVKWWRDCTLVHVPNQHAGWWAKLCLYAADIRGDLLYYDLDSTILGDQSDIAAVGQLAILRAKIRTDRGSPHYPGFQSALMYITEDARSAVRMELARQGGARCFAKYRGGDDRFLETIAYWRSNARFFQELLPNQIQHYRRDIVKRHRGKVPPGTRLVTFCKKPRPWDMPELKPA
jgi:hypothetical protein